MIRSSFGAQLARAELYSADSDGNLIQKRQPGHRQLHETRPTPNDTHGLEERQAISRAVAALTPEETEVLQLHELQVWRWEEFTIPQSKLDEAVGNGYAFIRTERAKARVGKQFPVKFTYEEIGLSMTLAHSPSQVYRLMRSARRKLGG